jgi:hypothetical protein
MTEYTIDNESGIGGATPAWNGYVLTALNKKVLKRKYGAFF